MEDFKELHVIVEVDSQDNAVDYYRSGRNRNVAGYTNKGGAKRAMSYINRDIGYKGTYKIAKVTGLEFVEV